MLAVNAVKPTHSQGIPVPRLGSACPGELVDDHRVETVDVIVEALSGHSVQHGTLLSILIRCAFIVMPLIQA